MGSKNEFQVSFQMNYKKFLDLNYINRNFSNLKFIYYIFYILKGRIIDGIIQYRDLINICFIVYLKYLDLFYLFVQLSFRFIHKIINRRVKLARPKLFQEWNYVKRENINGCFYFITAVTDVDFRFKIKRKNCELYLGIIVLFSLLLNMLICYVFFLG